MNTFKPQVWAPGDWNAFFGFGTNILVNMLTLTALMRYVLKLPDSLVFGTILPGPGAIFVAKSMRFKAPVRLGDEVTARVTVTKKVPEKKFVEFETACLVDGKPVLVGEATLMVPSREG